MVSYSAIPQRQWWTIRRA